MNLLYKYFRCFASFKYSLAVLLAVTFLLHLGPTVSGGFYADDYLQRSLVVGSNTLTEQGILAGVKQGDVTYFLQRQFSFFSSQFENYTAMVERGVLPWWSNDEAFMNFFRPLSALTHFIDYSLYPSNSHLMKLQSLLWYVAGLFIIYRLFIGLGLNSSTALVSLLFISLDVTIFSGLSWIAARNILLVITLGFLTVLAYHKGVNDKRWYAIALLLLLVSLLSAEASIAICAYLGAYSLSFDGRTLRTRIIYITPFIILTVGWRVLYEMAGYGVSGIDLYIDPSQSLGMFLARAIWAYPANYFELLSGLDVFSGQIRADIRQLFALLGMGLFLGLSYCLREAIRHDRVLRFFFVASLLSLIPSLTVTIASRTLFIPFVSVAVLFVYFLRLAFHAKGSSSVSFIDKILFRVGSIYIIVVHIFLSFLLAVFSLYSAVVGGNAGNSESGKSSIHGIHLVAQANKTIMIMNTPQPFLLAYFSLEANYLQQPLPFAVRALATNYSDIKVERLSAYELRLSSETFQFDASPLPVTLDSPLPVMHPGYMQLELLGLNRSQQTLWQEGLQRDFNDVTITVDSLGRNGPVMIRVVLKQALHQYSWFDWNSNTKQYRAFELPAVGESTVLKGVFSPPY